MCHKGPHLFYLPVSIDFCRAGGGGGHYANLFEHISPGLKKLHWLPIKYRIKFNVLTMVFKSLHNQAQIYISDLLELKKSNYSF